MKVFGEVAPYYITWFLLAGTLLVVYVLWHRQIDRKEPEDAP